MNDFKYGDILLVDVLWKGLTNWRIFQLVVIKEIINRPRKIDSRKSLSSHFDEKKETNLTKVKISLLYKQSVELVGTICETRCVT